MVGSMIMGRDGMRRVRGSERQAYSFGYDVLQPITSGTYVDINDAGQLLPRIDITHLIRMLILEGISAIVCEMVYF